MTPGFKQSVQQGAQLLSQEEEVWKGPSELALFIKTMPSRWPRHHDKLTTNHPLTSIIRQPSMNHLHKATTNHIHQPSINYPLAIH